MDFIGTWHIFEMEEWDETAFNTPVQAYIKIDKNYQGEFKFCLVEGGLDGKVVDYGILGKRFEFTWEGCDECDIAFGSGWCSIKEKDLLEGEFRFHLGMHSTFLARRAK